MANEPIIGSTIICALDENGTPIRIAVDSSYDPPRLLIELPDRALRDLGVISIDGAVKITDGTDEATVRDVTGAKALDVSIVDASGNQITSFGGGTQYTEGDADASVTGTALMWEDAADTLRVASAAKPLPTAQQGELPAGTQNIGDVDVASIAAGDNNIGNVDIVTGPTGASALQLQGAAADGAAVTGNPVLCGGFDGTNAQTLRTDTNGVQSGGVLYSATDASSNAACLLPVDQNGSARLPVGGNYAFNGTTWDRLRGTTDGLRVIGSAASGAAIAGAPVLSGARAATANPTKVTDGQAANLMSDAAGRLVVVNQHARDLVGIQTTTIVNSVTETTIVTAAASVFNDLTSLSITNASATAVTVTLKDSTAGTTRAIYDLAANGGIVLAFTPPLPQATVNTAWTITLSVNTVTVHINAVFVKNS